LSFFNNWFGSLDPILAGDFQLLDAIFHLKLKKTYFKKNKSSQDFYLVLINLLSSAKIAQKSFF
jgi:hypothetical protein